MCTRAIPRAMGPLRDPMAIICNLDYSQRVGLVRRERRMHNYIQYSRVSPEFLCAR